MDGMMPVVGDESLVVGQPVPGITVPPVVGNAGPVAANRYLEFFAVEVGNDRTREAYARAVHQFLTWCGAHRLRLETIAPLHVAAYIRTHPGSVATVKQHLSAIRRFCDWFVIHQVLAASPAASVRGPKHVVVQRATPVLSAPQARMLLDRIETGALVGLRDRALLSLMLFSCARVSAAAGMQRRDYFREGTQGWLRLYEKGGKRHQVPAHHHAEEAIDAYVAGAGLVEARAPLFQSVNRAGQLSGRFFGRRAVLAMIKRRASAAGLPASTSCQTLRATGITAYLSNGGTLHHAQRIANHASPTTTKLYDGTPDAVSPVEIERIVI